MAEASAKGRPREEPDETKIRTDKDPVLKERDRAQEQELRAQARGDIGTELKGFAREVAADVKRFTTDVEEDARDPKRRLDEQQGVPVHPEAEPKSSK